MSGFCSRYVLVALLNLLPYLANETVIVGVCFQKLLNKVNRFFYFCNSYSNYEKVFELMQLQYPVQMVQINLLNTVIVLRLMAQRFNGRRASSLLITFHVH